MFLGPCYLYDDVYSKTMVLSPSYMVHICIKHRLASLVIAFAIENLIFDPILSFLLGNTRFYRIRGFFYNFALGQ
jgi:hypothetical protein